MEMIPVFETLRITSETPLSKSKFEQYSYSYLFGLSYNLNVAISSYRFLEEFISPLRTTRIRRLDTNDLEAPKRFYIKDLVLHYQKGISSENLDHQFLSFFHVLEHFFENIYNEDIINRIKTELTKPDFSYKRNSNIEALVKIIQLKLKYKNDEFIINELEGLELTLKRHLSNIEEIKNDLSAVDVKLIEYFKITDVPFSGGNKVNFEIINHDEIYKNLAKRIYLTRNAIVHSKETEKVKYMPFRDDKFLIPENTLMRILTEKVIISTSKEI